MRVTGRAYRLPDEWWSDVNTDVILPGAFLRLPEEELASHAFAGAFDDFPSRVAERPILIAGPNFGCGSSREQAPKSLIGCGVRAIVAPSFGSIFFRNAVNLGLAPVRVVEAAALDGLRTDDELDVDLVAGTLGAGDATIPVGALGRHLAAVIAAGGLLPHLRAALSR